MIEDQSKITNQFMQNNSKRIKLKIVCLLIFPAILLLQQFGCSKPEWLSQDLKLFGTTVRIQVQHEKRTVRELAIKKVIKEFKRIEAKFNPYIDSSELSFINSNAFESRVPLSDEAFELIQFSLWASQKTQGSFDITYASTGSLYDFRKKTKPTKKELEKAYLAIGYENIHIDDDKSIRLKHPDTKISFGGFAKGYAVKQAIEIIKGYGIENALVTAGGDSMVIGLKKEKPWRTGIKAPRGNLRAVYTFNLSNKAISTSGDYERYFFDENDDRVHHIVNPTTGSSARKVQSVTVIGNDPMLTDALSTAMFVLGAKNAIVLAESLEGIEALIIDKSGDFHKSTGFPQHHTFLPNR